MSLHTITKMKRESSKAMINLLEVLMHTTLYTMGLQPQVNISDTTEHDVVLEMEMINIKSLADVPTEGLGTHSHT